MFRLTLGLAAGLFAVSASIAHEPVKIGLITTLSGPGGYIGADIRDGFQLAVEMEGGKLGGVPVRVIVEDDGFKPGSGKQVADRMLKSEGVRLFTGIVFSNIAGAAVPDILDAGAIYVSPNAGPSNFAGKDCHRNYFVISWQNDAAHEAAGQMATNLGYKRAFLLAPNYQAGKDALAGFRRFFKGEVIAESFTRLDQTDYSAEMAQIRAAKPDVVFQFHPGGFGIAFLRQYQQAGLQGAIPMVVASFSLDSTMLKSVGDAAAGLRVGTHWNVDFDNPANRTFMTEWTKKFGPERLPTYYASQGYDTALAIAAALKGSGGDLADTEKFRSAMLKAQLQLVRGPFKFGPNQHPIQDWFATEVQRQPNGESAIKTTAKILSNHGDFYAKSCKL
jgi:branched-chain amino acid transport system substrate-binding protein